MSDQITEPKTKTIAETTSFIAWTAKEPDGETTYHLELNNLTVHFFEEEWQEFTKLIKAILETGE